MIRLLEDLNQIGKVLAPFGVDLQANYNSFIPLDVKETENSYVVHADLPGMKKEDIFVDFSQDGILTVSVTKNSETEQKDGEKVLISERYFMKKERKLNFNNKVDGSTIKAKYENGVLVLELQKMQKKQAQSIVID